MTNDPQLAAELLALAAENVELRLQLAEAQEQCIELAVDAGDLQAEIEMLRARLAEVERDEWRRAAGRAVA
ncbi:hypothetical protein U8607_24725 [Methylobacterium durans]|uniref:hypothetical protein n=1 Tax=Methylobacterium durans TaxID=2202825 RepID=UPI002AFDECAC|nr:hypothetical protein [Methylobacterium durans]MEA1835281.1 hypothetical protein [Methylobacterium durans]